MDSIRRCSMLRCTSVGPPSNKCCLQATLWSVLETFTRRKRCTAPGHLILDVFARAGSTAIACEQAKRRAFMMEADPVMCDIIINRWEEFTNKKAKKI